MEGSNALHFFLHYVEIAKLQLSTYMDGSMDFQRSLSLLCPVQQLNIKISELWPGAKNSTTVQVALFKFVCFVFVVVHCCFFFPVQRMLVQFITEYKPKSAFFNPLWIFQAEH